MTREHFRRPTPQSFSFSAHYRDCERASRVASGCIRVTSHCPTEHFLVAGLAVAIRNIPEAAWQKKSCPGGSADSAGETEVRSIRGPESRTSECHTTRGMFDTGMLCFENTRLANLASGHKRQAQKSCLCSNNRSRQAMPPMGWTGECETLAHCFCRCPPRSQLLRPAWVTVRVRAKSPALLRAPRPRRAVQARFAPPLLPRVNRSAALKIQNVRYRIYLLGMAS